MTIPFGLGAYVDAWPQDPYASSIGTLEDLLDQPLNFALGYVDSQATWIDIATLNDLPDDHIPVLTIEFWNDRTSDINAGLLDAKIGEEADRAIEYGKEVVIRIFHEMNGNWYPWGVTDSYDSSGWNPGQGTDGSSNDKFISAWRRIYRIFKLRGATNAKFCFSPNCDTVGTLEPAGNTYWPGSAYVDYLGVDGYVWDPELHSFGVYRTFSQTFYTMYTRLCGLHPTAPFMVGETAAGQASGFQTDYLNSIFAGAGAFPRLTCVNWFHTDKEENWELSSESITALNQWINGIQVVPAEPLPPLRGGPVEKGEILVLDPAEIADQRIEFDLTKFVGQDGPDWGDAAIEQYLADVQYGQLPVDFRLPPRTITIPLTLTERDGVDYQTLRTTLQAKTALIQREGGWIKRSTVIGSLFAEVTGATLKLSGNTPATMLEVDTTAVLTLTCVPDWFGDPVDLAYASADQQGTPGEINIVRDNIPGDYPARAQITLSNLSTSDQRAIIWGIRSRHYDDALTAQWAYEAEDLLLAGESILEESTLEGATPDTGNNVVTLPKIHLSNVDASRPGEFPNWNPVLDLQMSTGELLTHEGSYRVFVRCHSESTNEAAQVGVRLRLVYGDSGLAAPVANHPAVISAYGNWMLLDLGLVRVDRAPMGQHGWLGEIQAMSFGNNMQAVMDQIYAPAAVPELNDDNAPWHENVSIDKVYFVPVDSGYGILRSIPPGYIDGTGAWVDTDTDDCVLFASNFDTDDVKLASLWTEGAWRQNRHNSAYGRVSEVIGDLPRIPASGLENRTVELCFRTSQGSASELLADAWLDNFGVSISIRPCYLFVPEPWVPS